MVASAQWLVEQELGAKTAQQLVTLCCTTEKRASRTVACYQYFDPSPSVGQFQLWWVFAARSAKMYNVQRMLRVYELGGHDPHVISDLRFFNSPKTFYWLVLALLLFDPETIKARSCTEILSIGKFARTLEQIWQ